MKVDIYKSASSANKYISVLANSDVSKVEVPDPDYAKLIFERAAVELDAKSNITADIKKHGYHLHLVKYPIN
jgi:uncharacterized protein YcgL (UPF0745 family)